MSYEQLGQHVRDLGERAYRQGERSMPSFLVSDALRRRSLSALAQRCFQDLPAILGPYERLPDPAGLQAVSRQLELGVRALYGPHPAELPALDPVLIGPNESLDALLRAADRLDGWTGAAAVGFRAQLVDPFPTVVRNQCLSIVLARAVLDAVRALWAQVRIVVDWLVEQAIRAVELLDDRCQRHEWGTDFAGFEAMHTTLRGAVPLQGFPVGSTAVVLPAGLPTGRPVLRVGGTTVNAVLDSVDTAVEHLTGWLNEGEQCLAWWVRDLRDAVGREDFVLVRPALAGATSVTATSNAYLGSAS